MILLLEWAIIFKEITNKEFTKFKQAYFPQIPRLLHHLDTSSAFKIKEKMIVFLSASSLRMIRRCNCSLMVSVKNVEVTDPHCFIIF